jgi:hypothetical protein
LDFCSQLFALEKKFENLEPDERQKEREKQSKPIAEAFFAWAPLTAGNPAKSPQTFGGKGGVAERTDIRGEKGLPKSGAFGEDGAMAEKASFSGAFQPENERNEAIATRPEWSLAEQTTPRAARTGSFAIPKKARAPPPSFIPSSKPPKKTA